MSAAAPVWSRFRFIAWRRRGRGRRGTCERPHDNRKQRFITHALPRTRRSPVIEVTYHSAPVPPTSYPQGRQSTGLQQELEPVRRKPPVVAGVIVESDEEWRTDDKVTTRSQESTQGPHCLGGVLDVFQHLIAHHHVKSRELGRRRAEVECGKVQCGVGSPRQMPPLLAGNFDDIEPPRIEPREFSLEVPVHGSPQPLLVRTSMRRMANRVDGCWRKPTLQRRGDPLSQSRPLGSKCLSLALGIVFHHGTEVRVRSFAPARLTN